MRRVRLRFPIPIAPLTLAVTALGVACNGTINETTDGTAGQVAVGSGGSSAGSAMGGSAGTSDNGGATGTSGGAVGSGSVRRSCEHPPQRERALQYAHRFDIDGVVDALTVLGCGSYAT